MNLRDKKRPTTIVNIDGLGELEFKELSYGQVRALKNKAQKPGEPSEADFEAMTIELVSLSCYCDGEPLFQDEDSRSWLLEECALSTWQALLKACMSANPILASQQIDAAKN